MKDQDVRGKQLQDELKNAEANLASMTQAVKNAREGIYHKITQMET